MDEIQEITVVDKEKNNDTHHKGSESDISRDKNTQPTNDSEELDLHNEDTIENTNKSEKEDSEDSIDKILSSNKRFHEEAMEIDSEEHSSKRLKNQECLPVKRSQRNRTPTDISKKNLEKK